MERNRLSVRLHGEPVGVLEQTLEGKKQFTYLANATRPLSIGMPISEEIYGDLQCDAFFGGFLPERFLIY